MNEFKASQSTEFQDSRGYVEKPCLEKNKYFFKIKIKRRVWRDGSVVKSVLAALPDD